MSRLRDARGRFTSADPPYNEEEDLRQAKREYDIWLAGEQKHDMTMRLAWIVIGILFVIIATA